MVPGPAPETGEHRPGQQGKAFARQADQVSDCGGILLVQPANQRFQPGIAVVH